MMSCQSFQKHLQSCWDRRQRPAAMSGALDEGRLSCSDQGTGFEEPCDWQQRSNEQHAPKTGLADWAEDEGHLAECESCRQLLHAHQALWDGWSEAPMPALSADFAHRVISRFVEQAPAGADASQHTTSSPNARAAAPLLAVKARWSSRPLVVLLCASAALLLAAFTLLWNEPGDSSSAGQQGLAKGRGAARERADAQAGGASSRDLEGNTSRGGNTSRRGMASRRNNAQADGWDTGSDLQSVAMFVLSPPDLKTVMLLVNRRFLDLLGDPAQRVEQLPGGLRQVARSVNVTIDLLRQALPVGRPSDSPPDSPFDDRSPTPDSAAPARQDLGGRFDPFGASRA